MEEVLRDGRVGVGDSADILESATDEEAARRARELYRDAVIPPIAADPAVEPYLAQGESLLGVRSEAVLGRVEEDGRGAVRAEGRLYVTNRRLLHLGERVSSFLLADIVELAMSDERILVTLADSRGATLDISDPRRFRVLVAAAKSATIG
jgi:hypothetical protein